MLTPLERRLGEPYRPPLTIPGLAGRRVIGLPDELIQLLELHREEQERDRRRAGPEWTDSGYVFTSPFGWPLVPSTDYDTWKKLLIDAEVRDGRLHDARHTAATVLLILGVPERVVMQIMGWSSTAMAARYQHVTGGILKDVAKRVGGLIWKVANGATPAPRRLLNRGVETAVETANDEGPDC
ncbi:tyrosine-type recombinase/integrase [Kitasatospora purpeofusca]|uniref:tyrosine-type recombinase/integrase n=1 Tax=Kitasatospora purpeofusca TaxID=67352 RepID=UPI0036670ABE